MAEACARGGARRFPADAPSWLLPLSVPTAPPICLPPSGQLCPPEPPGHWGLAHGLPPSLVGRGWRPGKELWYVSGFGVRHGEGGVLPCPAPEGPSPGQGGENSVSSQGSQGPTGDRRASLWPSMVPHALRGPDLGTCQPWHRVSRVPLLPPLATAAACPLPSFLLAVPPPAASPVAPPHLCPPGLSRLLLCLHSPFSPFGTE